MLDCACLAGMTALKHFRRPDVEVIGDEVTIVCLFDRLNGDTTHLSMSFSLPVQHSPADRAPVPLAIHHTPFCFTFAFFLNPETPPILDPTHLEQRLSAGLMSVALNAQRELCVVQKMGGVPLAADEVLRVVEIAVARAKELDVEVDRRLREDWADRKLTVEVR